MRHFAAAKAQGHLDLVALLEEALHRAHLDLVIMVVDAGSELDLLDLDDLLAFARLGGFLLLEKAELAEIEDLADRRARGGDDLDQVEPGIVGQLLRIGEIDDAAVLTFGVNELDLNGANVAIDARPAFLRGRGRLHGTANGHSPALMKTNGLRRRDPSPGICRGRVEG